MFIHSFILFYLKTDYK